MLHSGDNRAVVCHTCVARWEPIEEVALLDTLSKLLNQAENAATQEEAEAFFAKAQQLATLHAISLEQARAHTAAGQSRERPTHQQITIGAPRQHVNSHLCLLAAAVGEANSLRTNLASNNTFVIWFGLPSDLETASLLLNSIAHQMVRSADAFVRGREWAGEYDVETGSSMTAQKARKTYYTMYVRVIGRRLHEARQQAQKEFDTTSTSGSAELVLRGKEVEVHDYYREKSTARGYWKGQRSSFASSAAAGRAKEDAGRARIEASRQIGGQRPAVAS